MKYSTLLFLFILWGCEDGNSDAMNNRAEHNNGLSTQLSNKGTASASNNGTRVNNQSNNQTVNTIVASNNGQILPGSGGPFEGNQLYVAPQGDDALSREENTLQTPWASVKKALLNAQAGDVVNFREGSYSISESIITIGAHPGEENNRVVFTNYDAERVLFKDEGGRIFIDQPYWTFSGINADSSGRFFTMGDQGGGQHVVIEYGIFRQLTEGGGANNSPIFFNGVASDGVVRNNRIIGPGPEMNPNTAGIFIFRTQGIKVFNNEISGFPGGVFYKHPGNDPKIDPNRGVDTNIEIAYNFLYDNKKDIGTSMIAASIHDNLILDGNILLGDASGTGDAGPINHGGDDNLIAHNTFYNSSLILRSAPEDEGSGALGNIVINNLIMERSTIFPYEDTPHFTVLDYNLYPAEAVMNNNITYTLADWRTFYGQDANSITGIPIFKGGNGPTGIPEYQLTVDSPGFEGASDGKDLGADISKVGIGARAR